MANKYTAKDKKAIAKAIKDREPGVTVPEALEPLAQKYGVKASSLQVLHHLWTSKTKAKAAPKKKAEAAEAKPKPRVSSPKPRRSSVTAASVSSQISALEATVKAGEAAKARLEKIQALLG